MSRIFFTGCTHFGHANIIQLADRPFTSVEEMDAKLIENWNATVGKNDVVYHLGDFAWSHPLSYLQQLNAGELIHIRGNHDRNVTWHTESYLEIEANITTRLGLCLFHYPIEEWNGWYRPGILHLHCHTHQTERWTAPKRFNVTVEANDYRPVSIEEIEALAREEGFL